MSLFLNPKHVEENQYPAMSLSQRFVTEFLQHRGNYIGLTYLKIDSKMRGAVVLQFQEPPPANDLLDSFCFSHKLIKIKNRPLVQMNIHMNQHLFQSFLLLEHPLVKSVLYTIVENREIFFLVFHEKNSLSVHQVSLASQENNDIERKLFSVRQDMSLLITEKTLMKSLLKPYEKELPTIMKLVCGNDLRHLNLKETRLALNNPNKDSLKTG